MIGQSGFLSRGSWMTKAGIAVVPSDEPVVGVFNTIFPNTTEAEDLTRQFHCEGFMIEV
jgi:hypothetical protein